MQKMAMQSLTKGCQIYGTPHRHMLRACCGLGCKRLVARSSWYVRASASSAGEPLQKAPVQEVEKQSAGRDDDLIACATFYLSQHPVQQSFVWIVLALLGFGLLLYILP